MRKKNMSILLVFALLFQIGGPILNVNSVYAHLHADETVSSMTTEPTEELENEDETIIQTDVDEEMQLLDEEKETTDYTTNEEIDDEASEDEVLAAISDIFLDLTLAQVIAEELGVNVESAILRTDLTGIATLIATDGEISSIEGIQYLRNLEVLDLGNNSITDISPLAELTNLYQLELSDNEISDVSPLARLINLERLSLSSNQITDLRPLENVYLAIEDLDVQAQNVILPAVNFGEGTHLENFLPDGTRVESFEGGNDLYYQDGLIIWDMAGMNQTTFSVVSPFPFSVTVHQEVFEREIAPAPDMPRLSQESIDLMYEFIENNSEDKPFIVPEGMTFNDAINALDWGVDVTVQTPMSGLHAPDGMIWGGLGLHLNVQVLEDDTYLFDDSYWFTDVGLYVEFTDDLLDENPTDSIGSFIPQMGSAEFNTLLIGLVVLIVGGILIYLKRRK